MRAARRAVEPARAAGRIADGHPALAGWLAEARGVNSSAARRCARSPARVETCAGTLQAKPCVVCPGDDFVALFPDRIAAYGLTRCKLHMLRVARRGAAALTAAVMSDLGLVRYLGYAELPEAAALKRRLEPSRAGIARTAST